MKILQSRVKQADYNRTLWAVTPEAGTSLDEMLAPDYWAHVARQFKVGDRIEIVPDGGEWFAELFVRAVSANAATVFPLRHVVFAEAQDTQAQAGGGVEIKYRGNAKWSLVRRSDKAVLFDGGATREEAEAYAKDNGLM